MIGLFKSMGARKLQIINIFSWQGLFILGGGLMIGNLLALGFGHFQTKYHFVKLTAETYYMDAVPFYLSLQDLLLINASAVLLAYIFTLAPSIIVARISPSRSLQFR
jgi:lipoprotein-releasing system permease protein